MHVIGSDGKIAPGLSDLQAQTCRNLNVMDATDTDRKQGARVTYLWLVPLAALAFAAYVRFAPSDPEKWHRAPEIAHNSDTENSARRMVMSGKNGLADLHAVAMSEPRTTVLAGSVADGMVTYVTRSKLMQYPDYTTAVQDGDILKIFARSRFGRKDFSVNATRLDRWIDAL